MICISTPEVDRKALWAYVHGDADNTTIAHIRACEYCRRLARDMARREGVLVTLLYRFDCPSPHALGEFHLGMLSAAQRDEVSRHVASCAHCQRELAELDGFLTDLRPEVEMQPGEAMRVLVAELVRGAGRLLDGLSPRPLAPATAGVRGAEAGTSVYRAEDVTIAVSLEDDPVRVDRYMLVGLITGRDMTGCNVGILRDEEQGTATVVDDLGGFELSDLGAGEYTLQVACADATIEVRRLII